MNTAVRIGRLRKLSRVRAKVWSDVLAGPQNVARSLRAKGEEFQSRRVCGEGVGSNGIFVFVREAGSGMASRGADCVEAVSR